jgi:hypothetical protein
MAVAKYIPELEGVKHDAGKAPLDLLPFDAMESVAAVLEHGAAKYQARNWERGMRWGRLSGAALRHLFAWGRGERLDPESGLPHLAHAACCVLFLLAYELRGIGQDDRRRTVEDANGPSFILADGEEGGL